MRIFAPPEPSVFNIPHKIVLAMEHGLACVADREHKRVSCFKIPNGEYQFTIQHSDFQGPVYSISYSSRCGGNLYAITGKNFLLPTPMKGFVFNLTTQELLDSFTPPNEVRLKKSTISIQSQNIPYASLFNRVSATLMMS